jgi:hypothetical protein
LHQAADHALGVGPFGHVFYKLNLHLAGEGSFHGLNATVVLEVPAHIRNGRVVDHADFQRRLSAHAHGGQAGADGTKGQNGSALRVDYFACIDGLVNFSG